MDSFSTPAATVYRNYCGFSLLCLFWQLSESVWGSLYFVKDVCLFNYYGLAVCSSQKLWIHSTSLNCRVERRAAAEHSFLPNTQPCQFISLPSCVVPCYSSPAYPWRPEYKFHSSPFHSSLVFPSLSAKEHWTSFILFFSALFCSSPGMPNCSGPQ